jgi:hypothetical protein
MTRGHRIVAMPLIRAEYQRGGESRTDLSYSTYGRATWQWWCDRHSIEFKVLDQPARSYADDAPTVQRWAYAEALLTEGGPGTEVAMVDADTMIRWDAPNLFEVCDTRVGLGVVVNHSHPRWIYRSINAYQSLFPDVQLHWWQYFNAGLVVLGKKHIDFLRAFLKFYRDNREQLLRLQASGDFGTDQTPLNFLVRKLGVQLETLPAPFNLLWCLDVFPSSLLPSILSKVTTPQDLARQMDLLAPDAFKFIEYGQVWHFAMVPLAERGLPFRAFVMYDALRRCISKYQGMEMPPAPVSTPQPLSYGSVETRITG